MANLILFVSLFFLGAVFGSFLNVLIDRLPQKKSIIFSRSICEKCLKQILVFDLIPIISYIVLKGKCRNCKALIPARIFFVEFSCAILFPLAYFFAFLSLFQFVLLLLLILILIAISAVDIEKGIIPDKLLILFGGISLVYLLLTGNSSIFFHLMTAFLAFGFFLTIFLITRGRGIGFGDVKFAFFIGLLLSVSQLIIVFYVAFLTGAIVSIILIMLGIKKLKGESVPFGPFLSLGVLVAILFNKQILEIARTFFNL